MKAQSFSLLVPLQPTHILGVVDGICRTQGLGQEENLTYTQQHYTRSHDDTYTKLLTF